MLYCRPGAWWGPPTSFVSKALLESSARQQSHWWHSWVAVIQTIWLRAFSYPTVLLCVSVSLCIPDPYKKYGLKGSWCFFPAPKAVLSHLRSICVENQWTNTCETSDVQMLGALVSGCIFWQGWFAVQSIFRPDWHFALVFFCYHIKIQKWGLFLWSAQPRPLCSGGTLWPAHSTFVWECWQVSTARTLFQTFDGDSECKTDWFNPFPRKLRKETKTKDMELLLYVYWHFFKICLCVGIIAAVVHVWKARVFAFLHVWTVLFTGVSVQSPAGWALWSCFSAKLILSTNLIL